MKLIDKPSAQVSKLESWGWYWPDDAMAESIHAELQRELPPGHLLYGIAVEPVAYRLDMDDVLFRHIADTNRFTVIHLTKSRKREINAQHPSVCFDGAFDQFFAEEEKFRSRRSDT